MSLDEWLSSHGQTGSLLTFSLFYTYIDKPKSESVRRGLSKKAWLTLMLRAAQS
jgi:hypothetical protein